MNLKGSKTEKNLKAAFAGESQANRRYLYFAARRRTSKASTTSPRCSVRPRKARPATRTAISNTSKRSAIRRRVCRSAPTEQPEGRDRRRDARVHRHVPGHGEGGARRRLRAKSPTGSRRSRKPSARTRTASRRRWNALSKQIERTSRGPRCRDSARPRAAPSDGQPEPRTPAKAVSKRRRAIRSTGAIPSSATKTRSARSSSASSTSAMAAGAASACATRFRLLFDADRRIADAARSTASKQGRTGRSSTTATCATCAT